MANTLNTTLNKVGDAVEAIMGTKRAATPYVPNTMNQTCLEKFGMEARNEHLFRNEWRRALQYTKPLVDAEYNIQTEFKVTSYEDKLKEQADAAAERELKASKKKMEKLLRREEKKEAKRREKEKVIDDKNEPKIGKVAEKDNKNYNDTTTVIRNDLSWTEYAQQTGYVSQT